MDRNLNKACKLIVTIDIEDWPQSTWDHSLEITERAASNTLKVLDILAEHNQTVTMYVLGMFAERFPEIVRRIADDGHEVASHGYGHIEIFHQTSEEFREDAQRAKKLLEDLTGQSVIGYRAPDFSIKSSTIWALDILAELGFQYDSSIFPIKAKRYGISTWPTHPVKACLPSGNAIVEIPIATLSVLGKRLPVAGGGYHRLLPGTAIHWAMNRFWQQENAPFMAYCHPYEFDPNEFKFNALDLKIPWATRLHQGIGRRGFQAKFESIIRRFNIVQAANLVNDTQWPEYVL